VTPILFVDHAEAIGGAEQNLLALLEHLDQRRFHSFLACNEGPLAEEVRRRAIPVRIVDMPKLRGRLAAPWTLTRASLGLARIVRRERVRIVHSNAMRASFPAAVAARLTGRHFVWHVHDIHRERWYLRLMCPVSDRAIAVSRAVAAPIPCVDKATVVYNGVDPARFDPAQGAGFRAEIRVQPTEVLVGIVGRVWPWKGQQLFLEAAARIRAQHPTARFVVVGDVLFPSERDYLEELKGHAAALGLTDRVVFSGHRSDTPAVMAGLDLLVHTSRAEPFGLVLIEAMAARRPVVAFADGGVPEVVVHGRTGLLVAPGDIAGLAAAIQHLLCDPVARARMGRAGRARVEQLFTAERMARAVEAVYDGLLSRRGGGS
jgi:glycosyltransferase involved in cell wall biosynthesis